MRAGAISPASISTRLAPWARLLDRRLGQAVQGEARDGGVDWEGTLWRTEGDNLLNYLRAAVGTWRNDPRGDAELLTLFAQTRDEEAFTTLLGRHGGLVWQTMIWQRCRREWH